MNTSLNWSAWSGHTANGHTRTATCSVSSCGATCTETTSNLASCTTCNPPPADPYAALYNPVSALRYVFANIPCDGLNCNDNPCSNPVHGSPRQVTSDYYELRYSERTQTWRLHHGLDIVKYNSSGANVTQQHMLVSPCNGIILKTDYSSSRGYYIVIEANDIYDPITGEKLIFVLLHMNEQAGYYINGNLEYYQVNQSISKGDQLAHAGGTPYKPDGTLMYGYHLHLTLIRHKITNNKYTYDSGEYYNTDNTVDPLLIYESILFS